MKPMFAFLKSRNRCLDNSVDGTDISILEDKARLSNPRLVLKEARDLVVVLIP